MTSPFPHNYELALHWKGGPTGALLAAPREPIEVGKPPQFDGGDGWWSPEHLLIASAASCLMATYLSMAQRQALKLMSYRCQAEGSLDKAPDGFRIVAIRLIVSVEAKREDQERAERLLETAKKYCPIANSLKAPVVLEIRPRTAASH